MKKLYSPFQLLYKAHLLSLDVVLGAVICHLIFWKLPSGNVEINWFSVVVLSLVVWSIYVADRLFDNQKDYQQATERHVFHAENKVILTRLVVGCVVIAGVLVFFLPTSIIQFGILVASLTAIYLWLTSKSSQKSFFQLLKEPITALVYTAAVFGVAVVDKKEVGITTCGIGFFFLLISFQNLLLFSLFEYKNSAEAYSLASHWGMDFSEKMIQNIFLGIAVLGIVLQFFAENRFEKRMIFIEILMAAVLWQISQYSEVFEQKNRYRWVADAVFLLPVVLL